MNTLAIPPRPRARPSSSRASDDRRRGGRTKTIAGFILLAFLVLVLVLGTARNPNFWTAPDQRGDALMQERKFAAAAIAYNDPWRIGMAQYRNGDFEAAAKTFARVPGAAGTFNQGNAWLMHGQYDAAVASYDRALEFHPGWKDAEENKALALARKAKMQNSSKDADQEQTGQDKPDDIVFDQKGSVKQGQPIEIAGGEMSDEEMRATWLRRVQTTPGDFLRAKFAYQAARTEPQPPMKDEQ